MAIRNPQNLLRATFITALVVTMILSLMPQAFDPTPHLWDKAKHFAAFFLLAALLDMGWPKRPGMMTKCLLLLGYGLMVECLQGLTPDRYFSLLDLLADGIGIGGYVICELLVSTMRKGNKSVSVNRQTQANPPAPGNNLNN